MYIYISFFHTMCAVHNMDLFYYFNFVFSSILLSYCLSDFEMVPDAPIFTCITFILHSTRAPLLLQGLFI